MERDVNFFYHHICHICKIILSNNNRCSGCMLVSYCCVDHQKKDWKFHKPLCKTVQKFLKEGNRRSIFGHTAEKDWRLIRLSVICTIELELLRPLKDLEKQMFLFPNVCPVCYFMNQDKSYTCKYCNYIGYCSFEHQSQHLKIHKKECLSLKTCYEIDKLCFESKLNPLDFEIPYCEKSTSLENMDSFLLNFANTYSYASKIALSEHLSGILSLLYAIKSISLHEMDHLTIHIIGANVYEQSVVMTIELLFHCLPNLNKLNLVLIGPEVCENYLWPSLCTKCKDNRVIVFVTHKKLYHQYIMSNSFTAPNIIFSFNCGFSEFSNTNNDTWQESIEHIWNFKNILLAFTSYTKSEAIRDLSLVMETKPKGNDNLKLKEMSYQNPFKSLRPFRNWETSESAVFYNNNYLTLIELKS